MGYVLRPGETNAPAGIREALKNTNRLQDLTLERMHPGRTGNEVLADVLHAMREAKIDGSVYTHPIGDHGHAAGPLIGLWDLQTGVPGRGDVRLLPGTWFSIELGAKTPVPEWDGQELEVALEEDAVLDENGKMSWVLKRQSEYHLVK
jgi:Xaa-Pro aminopeptidase